jgi:tetratricopeptide (TPR) repeat protein
MTRFERGVQKTQEYLNEDPTHPDAVNWMGAVNIYRAVRAFASGDDKTGDRLFLQAIQQIDQAAAAQPQNVGIRATAGGTLMLFAGRLPERHYQTAVSKAREQYVALYKMQEAQIDFLPPHFKGEALAGMAEVEFRLGTRDAANGYLDKLIASMPNTRYAQLAESWRNAPERVTKKDRLVCQSCHEPGRLGAWKAANPQ